MIYANRSENSRAKRATLSYRLSLLIGDTLISLHVPATGLLLHHLQHFVKVLSFKPEKVRGRRHVAQFNLRFVHQDFLAQNFATQHIGHPKLTNPQSGKAIALFALFISIWLTCPTYCW
jgi:hypothetical protein